MHNKPFSTGHFVAAQHHNINAQTAWFINCAPLNSEVIIVCTITITVSICYLLYLKKLLLTLKLYSKRVTNNYNVLLWKEEQPFCSFDKVIFIHLKQAVISPEKARKRVIYPLKTGIYALVRISERTFTRSKFK